MAKKTHSELMSAYRSGVQADEPIFSEMRSNVRLVAGDHYLKNSMDSVDRSRASKNPNQAAKLRLTQNHIARAANIWINAIINAAPDVQIIPNNPKELKDKKAALMHQSVKAWLYKKQKLSGKVKKLAKDFFEIGECIVKLYFDPNVGPMVEGQEFEEIDQLTGQSLGVFKEQFPMGTLKFERVLGFNLLRDPSAKEWDECCFMTIRKMMDKEELLSFFPGEENEAKRALIQESGEETYNVYNSNSSVNRDSKKVLLLETYYKPSSTYPNGYFYIYTTTGILIEGELPGGIFPIVVCNFDDIATTPRGRSKIKQLRPIQGEINRALSKMAEHQVTLGDDKVLIPAGTKMQESNKLAGIRALQVSGMSPTIMPGRSGEQYLNYYITQIQQFDRIAEIAEIQEDKAAQMDPMAMMHRSMNKKKAYSLYAEKFEEFLVEMWEIALALFKHHVSPYAMLPVAGSHEMINMDEFKAADDISFQITLKPRTDDPESMIGKQMSLIQLMQYAGDKLSDIDIGQVAANLPFLDKSDFVSAASAMYDRATNMILKLDKGQDMQISAQDDAEYMLRMLDKRMSESDFDTITAQTPDRQTIPTEYIQQLYMQKKQEYEMLLNERLMHEQAKQAGQIPTSGAYIPVQMYENKPNADGTGFTPKRIQLPYDALQWLVQALATQGMTENTLQGQSENVQADMNQLMAPQGPQEPLY